MKIVNQILALIYALLKINYFKFIKNYDKSSLDIVWLCPIWPRRGFEYLFRTTFISDLAIINTLLSKNKKIRILIGGKKIGKLAGKNIHYSVSYHFDLFNISNYSSSVYNIVSELEKQGNKCILPSKDLLYWENKAYMHREFERLEINSPKTLILNISQDLDEIRNKIDFPILWKDVHSAGSLGVHKLNNNEDFKIIHQQKKSLGVYEYLLQELIDMRSDLRVTIVGNEIVHHYWRKNESVEWRPTSTTYGSIADYKSFPEKWRSYILDQFRKTGLITGAFDITFEKDDYESLPLFLEVSPSYDLNPEPPDKLKTISYKAFKKKYFIKHSYFKGRVNLIFEMKHRIYNELICRDKI